MGCSGLIAAIQGVSEPFNPLPHELVKGCWLALSSKGCSLFLGTLNKNRAFWSVSFRASEAEANRLSSLLASGSADDRVRTAELFVPDSKA